MRVRFREAANSREVFTFNLYLGAHDVLTAVLIATGESSNIVPKLITNDVSCSVPILVGNDNFFSKENFTGSFADISGDFNNRFSEGFVEVIEMGVLTGDSAIAVQMNDNSQANCSIFNDAWDPNSSNPYWLSNPKINLIAPTGGIAGNIILIDVYSGKSVLAQPTALADFSDKVLHYAIDASSPNLADGKTLSQIINQGKLVEINWQQGFQAVSSILLKASITNEYNINGQIGALTRWIITMPTRQFHLDALAFGNNQYYAPFDSGSHSGMKCEYLDYSIYDRGGIAPINVAPLIGIPRPRIETGPVFCYATNLVDMHAILKDWPSSFSNYHLSISRNRVVELNGFTDAPLNYNNGLFNEGWIEMVFLADNQFMRVDNQKIFGLPVIGFAVQSFFNYNAHIAQPGIRANYAGLFEHNSTISQINLGTSDNTPSNMHTPKENKGQVLLYPYYTVRNGFDTLISVVNTTDSVKALKIRFREGRNSRDVLSFNLYLAPFDVWTSAVTAISSTTINHIDEPTVKLLTSDISCTVPVINGQEFIPYGYDPQDNGNLVDGYDGLGTNLKRSQEGFLEIIEMGTVVGHYAVAASHSPRYRDPKCTVLVANWSLENGGGGWFYDSTLKMVAPDGTGGLYGSIQLINVAQGINMGYEATAIKNYSTAIQHTDPDSLLPNLSSGNNATTIIKTKNGILQTTWNSPLDAVSALFMQQSISNDYVISDAIGAQTDWVTTYPTKHYYVDPMFANNQTSFSPFFSTLAPDVGACEKVSFKAYNREHSISSNNNIGGTPPTPSADNCYSVNTSYGQRSMSQNGAESIFASQLLMSDWLSHNGSDTIYNLDFSEGWMQMSLGIGKLVGTGAHGGVHEIYGKPVLGFAAQKYVNGAITNGQDNAVLANYAVINMNRTSRHLTTAPVE